MGDAVMNEIARWLLQWKCRFLIAVMYFSYHLDAVLSLSNDVPVPVPIEASAHERR